MYVALHCRLLDQMPRMLEIVFSSLLRFQNFLGGHARKPSEGRFFDLLIGHSHLFHPGEPATIKLIETPAFIGAVVFRNGENYNLLVQ